MRRVLSRRISTYASLVMIAGCLMLAVVGLPRAAGRAGAADGREFRVYLPLTMRNMSPDTASYRYSFESDDPSKAWESDAALYAVVHVSRSADYAFAAAYSLKVDVADLKNGTEPPTARPANVLHWLYRDGAPLAAGNTATAQVYLPAGAPANLQARLFVQYGPSNAGWYPAGPVSLTALSPGTWTALHMTVPASAVGINTVGVQVANALGSAGWTGSFYVDAVTW